jgi:hypothetical protein
VAKDLVEIYNLALSATGTKARLTVAQPNEVSREAEVCNLWYPTIRDQVLRAAPWASCRSTANIPLLSTRDFNSNWMTGAPEPPFAYQYGLPADFLYPRYLDSFMPFILSDASGQPVLNTDEYGPSLIYTKSQQVPAAWDTMLYMAIVNALAGQIALPLHGKPSRAKESIEQANNLIMQARQATANENQSVYDSLPEWLIARGASTSTTPSQFIYSNGPLFSLNNSTSIFT